MYTIHDAIIDKNLLKEITENELSVINFSSKALQKKLEFCNLVREDLKGKYYDKDGNVIYKVDSKFYMFDLKIKELKDIF